ncbi:MAG TPA: efflux RND transporter periplasmic adaptor subunit [Patescibacteria group bacterium]|nr:efflux RND transporter periplasmic adaptor subunit [Patescibacteria group bacterium]
MKKLFKLKSFWVVLVVIVIIVIGVAVKLKSGAPLVEYTTEDVKLGDLIQTVDATGAVESAQDIDLNFKASGRLVYLTVDEGDKIKSGTVLARLDGVGLSAQVEQYQANLLSAQADLDKVKAGASSEDIKIVEEQVAKAENDLASLEAKRDNELETLREKSLDALNNSVFTAQVALDVVYNYLIRNDTTINLQINNPDLLIEVGNDYSVISPALNSAIVFANQANNQKDYNSIVEAADKMRNVLSDINGFLDNSYALADSIIINSSYPQTTKDTIKTSVNTQQSTNNTSLTSVQTAKSNLVNTVNSYNSQIQAAQNSLLIYQAELNLKKAGARDFEIKSAEAKVAQARAQLNKVQADLSEYSLVAPIDGTVTQVNFSIGEQTSLSQPVIRMLSTEKYEVKVDIPESDIAKIKVGDKAMIELDAFGSDHIFSGAITFIDPAQTVIQDVIYYRTTVSFDHDSFSDRVKPGMTADVILTTAKTENVLYIPQRAVKIRSAILGEVPEKYVEVLVGENTIEEKTVEIGLRGDGGLVEIISGLEAGEKVVTFKKNGS